jgi:hypothetical protein
MFILMRNFLALALAALAVIENVQADQILGSGPIDESNRVVLPGGPTPDSLVIGTTNALTVPFARSVTGAATRPLLDKLGDLPFTPPDMGAATDGTTAVDAAFARLMTVPGDVTISPGVWRLSQSATWPKGRVYHFAMGAQIKPDAGVTITIKGSVDAAPSGQIFAGVGKVVGLRFNRPEWWGAVGEYQNTVDSQPAFQAAYESARLSFSPKDPLNYTPGSRPIVEIGNGSYNFCRPWDVSPVLSQPIEIRGPGITNSGGILQTCASFTGYALLQIHGVQTGADPTHDFFIHDFSVRNSMRTSGATAGIAFNPEGAGYWLNGPKKSRLQDVLVYDFPIGYDVQNTVVMQMERTAYTVASSSKTNNTAVRLKATGSNETANTSEIDIIASRFIPCFDANAPASCANTINVDMVADTTAPGLNGVAAIRFENTSFYRSNIGVRGRASNKSSINDVWFNGMSGTQFDGTGCKFIDFRTLGPESQINNIHIDHVYHTKSAANCVAQTFSAEGGGSVRGIFSTNNWFIGLGGPASVFYAINGLTYTGNQIVDPMESGPAPVVIGASRNFTVMNNIIAKTAPSTLPFGVQVDASSDVGVVAYNVVKGIRNAAVNNLSKSSQIIAIPNVGAP